MPANDDFFRFGRSAAVLTGELRKRYPVDPCFALLDPLQSAVDLDQLRGCLPERPEVLLILDVSRMAQLRAAVGGDQPASEAIAPADLVAIDRVDALLGEDWRQACRSEPDDPADDRPAATATLELAAACAERLAIDAGYQTVILPVRLRPQLNPAYVLVLMTVRDDAAAQLADALGRAGLAMERAWHQARIQAVPPGAPTVFGDAPVFRPDQYLAANSAGWIKIIGANLTDLLDRFGTFRPGDHVPEIYGSTLGQAWTAHVRAAVYRLYQQGRVTATGRGEFWGVPLGGPST